MRYQIILSTIDRTWPSGVISTDKAKLEQVARDMNKIGMLIKYRVEMMR
jgi:hypothetical protein